MKKPIDNNDSDSQNEFFEQLGDAEDSLKGDDRTIARKLRDLLLRQQKENEQLITESELNRNKEKLLYEARKRGLLASSRRQPSYIRYLPIAAAVIVMIFGGIMANETFYGSGNELVVLASNGELPSQRSAVSLHELGSDNPNITGMEVARVLSEENVSFVLTRDDKNKVALTFFIGDTEQLDFLRKSLPDFGVTVERRTLYRVKIVQQ